ncbi:MAG TPA: hypothetical protein DIW47_06070 [Bacteroidetes bacterium]|nr:hypothetical protein [Bacteroidota bacterium]
MSSTISEEGSNKSINLPHTQKEMTVRAEYRTFLSHVSGKKKLRLSFPKQSFPIFLFPFT